MSFEERLDELLKDPPTEEGLRALLPTEEELTATIDRLLEERGGVASPV